MLNRIVLIGRLTRDPELRFTQNGKAVCSFTLAVDRGFTSRDGNRETDFINIVVWDKQGENCAQYLAKGRLAAVDGRLQIRSYDDKEGQRRTAAEVVAESVRFLSPKEGGSGSMSAPSSSFGGGFGSGASADDMPMTSDDLPF
jgi:single-strand DNA-binding protein